MKLIFSTCIFFSLIFSSPLISTASDDLKAVVDQRVELVSIIFRLAGSDEYNQEYLNHYTDNIKAFYSPYKNHAAVNFARQMIEKNHVAYDAVMSMAVHLTPAPDIKPLVLFSDIVPDERWGKKNAEEFARLVKSFYEDTNSQKFFEDHQLYYAKAEENFQSSMGDYVDVSWYESFYGVKPKGVYKLFIGLGNGGNNYGAKVAYPDGREDLYSVIGNALPDSAGFATFKPVNIQSTIIHEYNHSFINHLVYGADRAFKKGASRVFAEVEQQMKNLHYGNRQIMVCESLVRAGEIEYARMHGASETELSERIKNEQASGFIWMDKIVEAYREYQQSRSKFPTYESYLMNLAKLYESVSDKTKVHLEEFYKDCGQVVKIAPFSNGATVDPSTTEILIYFNKPMTPKISINLVDGGIEHFPLVKSRESLQWLEDGKVLKIKMSLKPSWDYGFILTPLSFRTQDGYPFKEYTISFKTSDGLKVSER